MYHDCKACKRETYPEINRIIKCPKHAKLGMTGLRKNVEKPSLNHARPDYGN